MLARRLGTILPALGFEEALETTRIHSTLAASALSITKPHISFNLTQVSTYLQ